MGLPGATVMSCCSQDFHDGSPCAGRVITAAGGLVSILALLPRQGKSGLYVNVQSTQHKSSLQLLVQAKYKKEHGSEPKYERIPHWDRSLLALQGPAAHEALRTLVPSSFNLDKFYFGQFATTSLKGIPAWVTRVG